VSITLRKRGDGKIGISAPYHVGFIKRIKAAGGTWDKNDKTWVVSESNLEVARRAMRAEYGRDDLPCDTCRVELIANGNIHVTGGPVYLLGRWVAEATGRDSGAKINPDVAVEGKVRSGGSVKNWATIIEAGARISMDDVPVKAVEARLGLEEFDITIDTPVTNGERRIVGETDVETLQKEAEGLRKRLAEIESALAEGGVS